MINSAEEFRQLRTSGDIDERRKSALEPADYTVWIEVIEKFPELKEWVAHNKTIPIEVLEQLATDTDPNVRCAVARKRKINDKIFNLLKEDVDEPVRHALLCNTKLSSDLKKKIKVDDSEWLKNELNGKSG